jgi:hypothetical protein
MNQTIVNILIVVATLAIIAAAIIVLINVLRIQGKGRQYKYRLSLSNQGNVASRYDLKAEDTAGLLMFQFALNGAPLGARQGAVPVVSALQAEPQAVRAEPEVQTHQAGGVKKAAGAAMGAGGAIAEMLMTIGSLLPGAIGRPLISLASQMRYGEYAANRVGNVQNQVQQFGKIGQSSGGTYVGGSSSPLPSSSPAAQQTPLAQQATPAPSVAVVAADPWSQTPAVTPGGSLALDLSITPLKADHTQRCTFSIASRAVEDPAAQLVRETGYVQLTGVSTVQRVLPWIVFALVLLGTLACSAILIAGNRG